MSKYTPTPSVLRSLLARHPGYDRIRVFAETGTYLAQTTMMAHLVFPEVHTVEISRELFTQAQERYGATPGVHFYFGDSRPFVAAWAVQFAEPVLWFLDAHWFKGTREPVGGRGGFPLWEELDAIAARRIRGDMVLVDDVHVFGHSDPSPEWAAVSVDAIAARLGDVREAVVLGPHAVVYR